VWAKTAGLSGVVITYRDHSNWGPGVSVRVLFLPAQGVDWAVLGSEDGRPSPLLVDLLTIGMMATWTRAINAKGQGELAVMCVVKLHWLLCESPRCGRPRGTFYLTVTVIVLV